MGRRKVIGIIAVVGLTFLNIWMAKFVFRPLKAKKLMQESRAKQKLRKSSDILVLPVDNIHPIQHLEQAAQIEESQHLNKQGNLHSLSHQEPPLPVVAAGNQQDAMLRSQNHQGPLLGSQDNTLSKQGLIQPPPVFNRPALQEEPKPPLASNNEPAFLDSLDTADLETINLSLQELKNTIGKHINNKSQPRMQQANGINQHGMQQAYVQQAGPNQGNPFIAQQNNNAYMPKNPWDPNPNVPNPVPNLPSTNTEDSTYQKGTFILDSIKNNLSPPVLAAKTSSPFLEEVANKLSDIFKNPNLPALVTSDSKILLKLQKVLQLYQEQQQGLRLQNQRLPEEGIPQLPNAEIPTPDNKAVFEKMLQNIASENAISAGTDESRVLNQIFQDLQNPSSSVFQGMNGPVKSETFINNINSGQHNRPGGKDL